MNEANYINDHVIERITSAEALEFANKHGGIIDALPGKNLRAFGLKYEGEILAIAIICNPRKLKRQLEYTTELFSICSREEIGLEENIKLLTAHLTTAAGLTDIFSHQPLPGFTKVSNDSIYQWRNERYRFYTYRITSSQDAGYYFGRHRTTSLLESEMLTDGYFGSGGVKFRNWINKVGSATIQKEILGVHDSWKEVVAAEAELIGDLYKLDKNCKNSKPGGVGLTGYFPELTLKICSTHGETFHQGESCKKCSAAKAFSQKHCSIHGETHHQGDVCLRCRASIIRTVSDCSIHGQVGFIGNRCTVCLAKGSYELAICPKHGEKIHHGGSCKTCVANDSVTLKSALYTEKQST